MADRLWAAITALRAPEPLTEREAFDKWWLTFKTAKGSVYYDDDFAYEGWLARAALEGGVSRP